MSDNALASSLVDRFLRSSKLNGPARKLVCASSQRNEPKLSKFQRFAHQTTRALGHLPKSISLSFCAAKAGVGVAIVPLSFVDAELNNNSLVRIGSHELISERDYYLISDPASEMASSNQAFRDKIEKQSNLGV